MHRFQRISATAQTLNAQLFEDERIIVETPGVGLYDGKEKTVAFDSGRLFLTSHRLVYLDAAEPQRNSRYLDLKHVKQTEYWVGFMKSSPKITLVLGDLDTTEETNGSQEALYDDESLHPSAQTWTCHICGMQNLASKGNKCSLCGIRKADGISTTPSSAQSTTSASINGSTTPAQPPVDTGNLISCPSCTYLNHPSMVRCEICESPLGTATAKPSRPSTPSSRPATPALPGQATPTFVRLSFRKGGVQACYAALKKALQAKEWVVDKDSRRRSVPPASGSEIDPSTGHRTTTAGIDGLLRTIDLDARDREDDMQDALSDLEALMARAKEMVALAESLNAKVIESSAEDSDTNDQASNVVKRSLASLGLSTPAVTPDMMRDEQEYHRQLAKELATVLLGSGKGAEPIMHDGKSQKGLVGLDEIWCMWNRARGVALVSPKDLKQACAFLPGVSNPPIRLRTFKSGLTVLHTPYFEEANFVKRLQSSLIATSGEEEIPGLANMEIARLEGISMTLTQQMLETLEERPCAPFVRDDGDLREGTRWQLNYFEQLEKEWNVAGSWSR